VVVPGLFGPVCRLIIRIVHGNLHKEVFPLQVSDFAGGVTSGIPEGTARILT
jgi:hypothetical protein